MNTVGRALDDDDKQSRNHLLTEILHSFDVLIAEHPVHVNRIIPRKSYLIKKKNKTA